MRHFDPVTMFPLVLGLGCLGFGILQFVRELSPRRWVRIPGKIIASSIAKQATGRGGYQFVPKIEYEYRYQEQLLKSSCRRFGNYISGCRWSAEDVGARYSVGAEVTVLVNPENPENAVLEVGTTPLSWVPFIFGVFFTTTGILANL
jgi:hypothetical protein